MILLNPSDSVYDNQTNSSSPDDESEKPVSGRSAHISDNKNSGYELVSREVFQRRSNDPLRPPAATAEKSSVSLTISSGGRMQGNPLEDTCNVKYAYQFSNRARRIRSSVNPLGILNTAPSFLTHPLNIASPPLSSTFPSSPNIGIQRSGPHSHSPLGPLGLFKTDPRRRL